MTLPDGRGEERAMAAGELGAGLADLPVAAPLRLDRLSRSAPTSFELVPDPPALQVLAGLLGVSQLRKLRFAGTVTARRDGGWSLTGQLGATVVQPCRTTLVPVTTRIEEPVERRYLPQLAEVEVEDTALPEDVDAEPLPEVIDPAAVMVEALALAVPDFPRAPEAALDTAVFAPPGVEPLRDADVHPMAALAALRDRMRRN